MNFMVLTAKGSYFIAGFLVTSAPFLGQVLLL